MTTLIELLKQRDELSKQIEELKRHEMKNALAKIHELVEQFGITASDIFPDTKEKKSDSVKKVPPKYRNKETGKTWTGRGKPPKWIAGKDREQYNIV